MHTDALDGAPLAAPTPQATWQPLPRRARLLMMLGMSAMFLPAVPVAVILAASTDLLSPVIAGLGVFALAVALGAWRGARQYACFAWRLDDDGLAVRRGTLWQSETRVPATRVQHLDLKRGPLQRRRGLATLVVHTAGTRMSTVTVVHMDDADAEHLRDALAQRIDDVDD